MASLRNCINCVHCDDHFFIFRIILVATLVAVSNPLRITEFTSPPLVCSLLKKSVIHTYWCISVPIILKSTCNTCNKIILCIYVLATVMNGKYIPSSFFQSKKLIIYTDYMFKRFNVSLRGSGP